MIGRAAVLAIVMLAGIAPANADPTSEALLRDFIAWVDSSPDWSASTTLIRSEGQDTFAEGLVFSRDNPRVSISVEELRLSNLAARDGGGFEASAIEMRSGEVVTEVMDLKIPSAVAGGASLPSLAGVTIDPRHMMRSIARFYAIAAKGEVGGLKIPEMSIVQHQPDGSGVDVEVDATYRNMTMGALSGGVLEHQEIGPISVAARGPSADAVEFFIDKIEVGRTDIGAMARILDETQYDGGRGDMTWRPLVARAAYHGLRGHGGDDVSFRVEEVAVENVEGRQPEKSFTGVWDQIMDPAVPDDARNDLALEALTGMLGAFRIGTVRLDALSVEAPKENAAFSLDGFTLTGWSSAGLDNFILNNLRFDSPEAYVSLGSMQLGGFVSPDLSALLEFAALEKNLDIETHAEGIKRAFAALPRLDHFGMDKLAAGKTEADAVTLDRLSVDLSDWNEIFAEATDVRLDGLTVPRELLELEPEASDLMDGLGYKDVTIGIALTDRWAPDAGTDQANLSVTVADAGDVELSYTLTGLTMDWLMRATAAAGKSDDSEAALVAVLRDLNLERATLKVTDRSLLDRAFEVVAKRQGVTVGGAAYREQMRAALPFIISAVIPPELAKRLSPPLQGFMAGGQTLSADVTPLTPLGLMDLLAAADDPLTLPDRLNLTLSSGAPKE